MIEKIKAQVNDLLNKDNSGHGMEHVNRVLNLSLKFAKKENANVEVVSLIALLHDVDDYKLFGEENAKNLTNAKKIMSDNNIPLEIQQQVLEVLHNFGYTNAILGKRPTSLEGKIVSDADMCDAIGVNGLLRTFQFSMKHNRPFFDKNIFPSDTLTETKKAKLVGSSSVCHMFEKILKLKKLMFTESGKIEIEKRHQITIDILYQLFEEENAPEWTEYLDNFIKENY